MGDRLQEVKSCRDCDIVVRDRDREREYFRGFFIERERELQSFSGDYKDEEKMCELFSFEDVALE